MSEPPANLVALIESGSATVARAWIVTRRDGQRFGFTDHDAPLMVDSVECRPDTGALGSAIQRRLGLEVDRSDIRGALVDERLGEQDLIAGRWRGARVDIWLVDWTGAATPWRMESALVGETRQRGSAWVWELSDVLALASQREGAVIQKRCAWVLGDADCGVDLTAPTLRAAVTVVRSDSPRRIVVSGLSGFADGWFNRGVISWTGGANAGSTSDVRRHQSGELDLVDPPGSAVSVGDTATITAGCDHTAETCRAKFSNGARLGGDPFSITEAEFLAYPREDDELDGGSFFS